MTLEPNAAADLIEKGDEYLRLALDRDLRCEEA
jgi:hypothetical protein